MSTKENLESKLDLGPDDSGEETVKKKEKKKKSREEKQKDRKVILWFLIVMILVSGVFWLKAQMSNETEVDLDIDGDLEEVQPPVKGNWKGGSINYKL